MAVKRCNMQKIQYLCEISAIMHGLGKGTNMDSGSVIKKYSLKRPFNN